MAARFRRLYAQYEGLYRQLEKQGYIPSVNSVSTLRKSEVNARDLKRLLQLHKDLNTLKQRLWSTQPPKGLTKSTTISKMMMNGSTGAKFTNLSNGQNNTNKIKVNSNGAIKKLTNALKRGNDVTTVGARSSPRSPVMSSLSPPRSPARAISVSPPRGANEHQQQPQHHGSTKSNANNGTGSSNNAGSGYAQNRSDVTIVCPMVMFSAMTYGDQRSKGLSTISNSHLQTHAIGVQACTGITVITMVEL